MTIQDRTLLRIHRRFTQDSLQASIELDSVTLESMPVATIIAMGEAAILHLNKDDVHRIRFCEKVLAYLTKLGADEYILSIFS